MENGPPKKELAGTSGDSNGKATMQGSTWMDVDKYQIPPPPKLTMDFIDPMHKYQMPARKGKHSWLYQLDS
jgi:hypothetical protein